jgi:hypothetical protein
MLYRIEYAGGNEHSFAKAGESMTKLAELPISAKHEQRLTERLGGERAQLRDQQVQAMKAGTLQPTHKQAPLVVAIHVDAGKVQFRQDDGAVGVRDPHWQDVKAACLQTYSAPVFHKDPQPQPPAAFLDPPRVLKLVSEMERVRGGARKTSPGAGGPLFKPKTPKKTLLKKLKRPDRLMRTVVATTEGVEGFGWQVAAEAMARHFYEARKKAIVGDGGNWIGPLQELHFPGWELILDFLHLLVHLWAAALAAHRNQPRPAWELYERMLRDAWAGRVQAVVGALEEQARRLGPAPKDAAENDVRLIVAGVLAYVQANARRMDYARYRKEGLPVTSALVESLIKQINFRMKGSEKFWVEGGAEAVLQVRAAHLSQDGRAEDFYLHRPRGRAAGQGRLNKAA